jgi:hypothetical protein
MIRSSNLCSILLAVMSIALTGGIRLYAQLVARIELIDPPMTRRHEEG